MKNGVPFDVAFTLPKADRRAFAIAIDEMDRSKHYDWPAIGWER